MEDARQEMQIRALQKNGCVLVVEDEEGIRETVTAYLKAHGVEVIGAKSGKDALEQLAQGKHMKVSVVVTDIMMPDVGGPSLVESMKSGGYECGYVFISGFTDQQTTLDPKTQQNTRYLQKPFKLTELRNAIWQVSGGAIGAWVSPALVSS